MVAQPVRRLHLPGIDHSSIELPRVEQKRVPYAFVKRCIDIIVSLVLLAILAIPMAIICLIIRLTSRGPAIYRSERIGLGGRPFMFLKFRSMHTDAEARLEELRHKNEQDGPVFKIAKDPRIIPIGRFLRKSSLDELPQLLHVLTGQMTLVGPRPPIRYEVMQYDRAALERLTVKPGITCYWQIGGRSNLSFEKWIELDRQYIREMSLSTDIKILLRTPMAVFTGRGAY